MSVCVKRPNEVFESPYHPKFTEQAAFPSENSSFYLALGSGFLETLIRQPDEWVLPTMHTINSLVPRLETLTSPFGLDHWVQVCVNLMQALISPPKVCTERMRWLQEFLTSNAQGACDALQVMTRALIAHYLEPQCLHELFDFAKPPEQVKKYVGAFCAVVGVQCQLSDATGYREMFGTQGIPCFYLHQIVTDQFALLYHERHLAQSRGEVVNIGTFPFINQRNSLAELIEAFSLYCIQSITGDQLLAHLQQTVAVAPEVLTNAMYILAQHLQGGGVTQSSLAWDNVGERSVYIRAPPVHEEPIQTPPELPSLIECQMPSVEQQPSFEVQTEPQVPLNIEQTSHQTSSLSFHAKRDSARRETEATQEQLQPTAIQTLPAAPLSVEPSNKPSFNLLGSRPTVAALGASKKAISPFARLKAAESNSGAPAPIIPAPIIPAPIIPAPIIPVSVPSVQPSAKELSQPEVAKTDFLPLVSEQVSSVMQPREHSATKPIDTSVLYSSVMIPSQQPRPDPLPTTTEPPPNSQMTQKVACAVCGQLKSATCFQSIVCSNHSVCLECRVQAVVETVNYLCPQCKRIYSGRETQFLASAVQSQELVKCMVCSVIVRGSRSCCKNRCHMCDACRGANNKKCIYCWEDLLSKT